MWNISILSLFLLALAGAASAASLPWPTNPPAQEGSKALGTAYGGALDPGAEFPVQDDVTEPPTFLTISLVNSHGVAISTTHNSNVGAPSPVSGALTPGTLEAGATAAIAVPTNWAGIISVNDAVFPPSDNNSLIEANYQYRELEQYAIADVDVSYVNGFTLPITCSCDDIGVTGCNKDLYTIHPCPFLITNGSCANPLSDDSETSAADTFFAPCEKAAYTYPNDHDANSQNQCQSGQIVCCVGASCPPSYKQNEL